MNDFLKYTLKGAVIIVPLMIAAFTVLLLWVLLAVHHPFIAIGLFATGLLVMLSYMIGKDRP